MSGATVSCDLDGLHQALEEAQAWIERSHLLPAPWLARLLRLAQEAADEIAGYRRWMVAHEALLDHLGACARCQELPGACSAGAELLACEHEAWSALQIFRVPHPAYASLMRTTRGFYDGVDRESPESAASS